jgi:hypothetical protein
MATGNFEYENVTIQGSSRAHLGHNFSWLPAASGRPRKADIVYRYKPGS